MFKAYFAKTLILIIDVHLKNGCVLAMILYITWRNIQNWTGCTYLEMFPFLAFDTTTCNIHISMLLLTPSFVYWITGLDYLSPSYHNNKYSKHIHNVDTLIHSSLQWKRNLQLLSSLSLWILVNLNQINQTKFYRAVWWKHAPCT
jgi:hypothetical protein